MTRETDMPNASTAAGPDDRQGPGMPDTDAEFDRALAARLACDGDTDVALLSRAVLTALAEGPSAARDAPRSEVLSEPWPWALGFGGLLLLAAGLGYGLVPLVDGGLGRALADLARFTTMIGVH